MNRLTILQIIESMAFWGQNDSATGKTLILAHLGSIPSNHLKVPELARSPSSLQTQK